MLRCADRSLHDDRVVRLNRDTVSRGTLTSYTDWSAQEENKHTVFADGKQNYLNSTSDKINSGSRVLRVSSACAYADCVSARPPAPASQNAFWRSEC